jgi:hypothetical protein
MNSSTLLSEAVRNGDLDLLCKILVEDEEMLETIGDEALEQGMIPAFNLARQYGYRPSGEAFGRVVARGLLVSQKLKRDDEKGLEFMKTILESVDDVGHAIISAAQFERKDIIDLLWKLPNCDKELPQGWMRDLSLDMFTYLRKMVPDREDLIHEAARTKRSDLVNLLLPEFKSIPVSFIYEPELLAALIKQLSPDRKTLDNLLERSFEHKRYRHAPSKTFEILLQAGAAVPDNALQRTLELFDVEIMKIFLQYGAQDIEAAFLMESKTPRANFKILELLLPRISEETYRQICTFLDDLIARKKRGYVLHRKTKAFMLEKRPLA